MFTLILWMTLGGFVFAGVIIGLDETLRLIAIRKKKHEMNPDFYIKQINSKIIRIGIAFAMIVLSLLGMQGWYLMLHN
ncbi:MAG: hypothetical protein IJ035_06250 [Oscillospiraceae bacterium]|nr:hypothetical protein [Oscillospiraceae bacterium]